MGFYSWWMQLKNIINTNGSKNITSNSLFQRMARESPDLLAASSDSATQSTILNPRKAFIQFKTFFFLTRKKIPTNKFWFLSN